MGCDDEDTEPAQKKTSNPLRLAELDSVVRVDATSRESTPGRIRTCDLRIRSQHATPINPEVNAHFSEGAAPGAAVDAENSPIDADLQHIIIAWPQLSEGVRETVIRTVEDAIPAVVGIDAITFATN